MGKDSRDADEEAATLARVVELEDADLHEAAWRSFARWEKEQSSYEQWLSELPWWRRLGHALGITKYSGSPHTPFDRSSADLVGAGNELQRDETTLSRVIQLLFRGTRIELRPAAGCGAAERLPRQFSLPESWFGRPVTVRTEKLEFADTSRPTCWRIYPEEAEITLQLRLLYEEREVLAEMGRGHELLISEEDAVALVAIEVIDVKP
jgi:hypothetical protein